MITRVLCLSAACVFFLGNLDHILTHTSSPLQARCHRLHFHRSKQSRTSTEATSYTRRLVGLSVQAQDRIGISISNQTFTHSHSVLFPSSTPTQYNAVLSFTSVAANIVEKGKEEDDYFTIRAITTPNGGILWRYLQCTQYVDVASDS